MKLNLLFIFSVVLWAHSNLFAGVVNSGGGKAVVCYSDKSKQEISYVKSLDLVEGELLEKHTHRESDRPFEEQVEEIIKQIPQETPWRQQLETLSKEVIKGIRVLPAGVSLKPVDDSYEVFLYDQNCEIQQLAHFLKIDSIMINGDFWRKMSETQKTALVLHETVYYLTRIDGETDSKRARRIVSFLMSEGVSLEAPTASIPRESYQCYGESSNTSAADKKKTLVYVYKNNENGFDFNFLILGGKVKLSKFDLKLPIQYFPPRVWEPLIHNKNVVNSNFEKEATNLKIEFLRDDIGPVKFKISGQAVGYYGNSVDPVIVSCRPKFLSVKNEYYNFEPYETVFIPAQGYACGADFSGRLIGKHAHVPVEFAYQINRDESLELFNLQVYVKDNLGVYQRMDVKDMDVDCLTRGSRKLSFEKNFFRNYLNFEIPKNIYENNTNSDQTIKKEAVLIIRLRKEFADTSWDIIEYKVPFVITRFN